MYACMYACMYYVYTCVCIYIYVYGWLYVGKCNIQTLSTIPAVKMPCTLTNPHSQSLDWSGETNNRINISIYNYNKLCMYICGCLCVDMCDHGRKL